VDGAVLLGVWALEVGIVGDREVCLGYLGGKGEMAYESERVI